MTQGVVIINIKGKLCLSHDKDDYIMFSSGRIVNLTDKLNLMLLQDVKMTIRSMYNKKILLDAEGKLIKDKVSQCFYLYHINGVDVDSVLWNLVGSKLDIKLKNVTKE